MATKTLLETIFPSVIAAKSILEVKPSSKGAHIDVSLVPQKTISWKCASIVAQLPQKGRFLGNAAQSNKLLHWSYKWYTTYYALTTQGKHPIKCNISGPIITNAKIEKPYSPSHAPQALKRGCRWVWCQKHYTILGAICPRRPTWHIVWSIVFGIASSS